MNSLQSAQRNIQDLQQQIASGNKYTKLSDNPAAISRSLSVQSAIDANSQYQENTSDALVMLRHANSALQNVLDAAKSIRNLIIEAGDAALDSSQLKDITAQIEANKKIMLDNLNTKVAGQYLFGGTSSSSAPFVEKADGSIEYQGSDERMKYVLSESLLGDISFTGSDIIPENEDSYFICSHYVPLDWKWTGREEKVQITVGNRTLSVFIPEDWSDNDVNKTNLTVEYGDPIISSSSAVFSSSDEKLNYSDNNGFRDPNEVSGISLQDLVSIINSSLEEQGADMLVSAHIEYDYDNNRQQLIIKSNTGEKVGITGWPDTDYMPMEATITSHNIVDDDLFDSWSTEHHFENENINGVTGRVDLRDWSGRNSSNTLTLEIDGSKYADIKLSDYSNVNELVDKLNSLVSKNEDGTAFASLLSGHLVFQSDKGQVQFSTTDNGLKEIFGWNDYGDEHTLTGLYSSLGIKVGDTSDSTRIFIFSNDSPQSVAERINYIDGVNARASADGKRLVIAAKRTGDLPEDRLHIDEAQESLHYPPLTITALGAGLNLYNFEEGQNSVRVTYQNRLKDQSHIDIFDYLGMETAIKSREFAPQETLNVEEGTQLHWRVMSGGRSVDIKLNSGSYTIEELAQRIKSATIGWGEVTVEPGGHDVADDWGRYTEDFEQETKRIVMRGYNGEQIIFLDMNEYNYADKIGISTALKTAAYDDKKTLTKDDDYLGIGMKCVNFPSAPCVDDNVGVPMRVQMNCGMSYDVNIKKADVIDKETGFVDRALLMQEIVDQVNDIEGHDIMGFVQHVDSTGQEINGSCSIYFLSGESFTVVDMPFDDPEWNDYSGGLAAQLGIHGGVSSNLKQTHIKMKDNATFAEAYASNADKYGDVEANPDDLTFREGTIRFSNLAHSVEIDVSANDTVKDVMDRLRVQAGDWLYVNYYDEHMGQLDARNAGDYPLISISSVDGSAVNVIDIKGHIAEDALGLSTGIQGRLNYDGTGNGIMAFDWPVNEQNPYSSGSVTFPAETLNITVAGYTHTLDLTAIRDVTNDNEIKADDIAEFINARMQDYDVRAEINDDQELVVYSPRGYSIKIEFIDDSDFDVTEDFLGDDTWVMNQTHYRGGYNLEGKAYKDDDDYPRGVTENSLYDSGIHTQNATIRSGANTMRQNGFGTINDIISAIESGNRDDLLKKMLPRMDDMINNILSVMAEDGALQSRYNYNNERLVTENAIMTENYDNLVKIDPADAITQLMVADYMYQANLAVIARLIQPSLLDFLG